VVRYADDLVILHADKAVIEQVQQLVSPWLAGMGLALKPSKTCITHTLTPCENHLGFDFLGFVRHGSCTRGCCDRAIGTQPGILLPVPYQDMRLE
jgi:hypothetical protein